MKTRLRLLYERIDERVAAIHEASNAQWPCQTGAGPRRGEALGCDGCCHQLHEIPRITETEWEPLAAALAAIPEHHSLFDARIKTLSEPRAEASQRSVVCPFVAPDDLLGPRPGSCLVYEGRPAACRTYGYFADRGDLLGCETIVAYAENADPPVLWGNQLAVDRELDTDAAPRRSFVDYWRRSFVPAESHESR